MTIPVGLQLYSVRDACANDLEATLAAIADMGYDGVEFAGYHGRSAQELRDMLATCGLQVAGTHTGIDTLLGDQLEETVRFNQELGNRYLIVPGLPPEYHDSAVAWQRTAELFGNIAERLAPYDMFTGYHNHTHEFATMDGEVPFALFLDHTPERVVMQIDTGNARHGGADILPYIQDYPGRARTVHLKEYSGGNPEALLGEGDIDWALCFNLCERYGGTEWYIVEQEAYPCAPLDAVRICRENLHRLGR